MELNSFQIYRENQNALINRKIWLKISDRFRTLVAKIQGSFSDSGRENFNLSELKKIECTKILGSKPSILLVKVNWTRGILYGFYLNFVQKSNAKHFI